MSDWNLIKLDSYEWTKTFDYIGKPPIVLKKLKFGKSPIVFGVHGEYVNGRRFKLTVAPEPKILINQISYIIEYQVYRGGVMEGFGIFDETNTTVEFGIISSVKLTLKETALSVPFPHADLKTYVERGAIVTLVGSDGSVPVPRRLLKMHSEALEAMFKHDTQEKRTGQIIMKDFDSKTLLAFKQFLMTGEIENGKDTALGLILLGDKYNVQAMKEAAEDFVKSNVQDMDKDEVFEIFSKLSRETLIDAMIAYWSTK